MSESPLGDFLRARRGQLAPESVGFGAGGRRRVPGLRREEVAALGGLSVDYYARLEQGRERHPSAQVLEALAVALRLDEDARAHLRRIAGAAPAPARASTPERVAPELLELMESWPDSPALVLGTAYDVLAGNRIAFTLFEGLERGSNLMLTLFLDPAARTLYPDWPRVAADAAAGFRALTGGAPDDARIAEVLTALLDRSPEFARLWERHEARVKRADRKRFHHRQVGELHLRMQAFDVAAAPGQQLVVYHAEPGTPSADAVMLLGALAAGGAPVSRR